MQVAGNLCEECGGKLFLETEGLSCADCDVVYCHECLDASENCKKCGADMVAQLEAQEAEKIEGDQIAERQKSLNMSWYPWALGIAIVFNIFSGATKAASGNQIDATITAIVFLILILLLVDYFRRGVPLGMSRKPATKKR